jgi:hypothetical protein
LILLRLVKSGYGTLKEVKEMTAREVLQALAYEKFLSDYEEEYFNLNSAKK